MILANLKQTALALALTGSLALSANAQDNPSYVGKVVDIDGPRLYSNRLKSDGWFQAYSGMRTFLSERLRTDKETQAVLEFLVGGRAGIGRSSHIQIVSPRDVEEYGSTMRINAGTFWAKMDRQEKEFRIQTAGGVIGIEGTELLINVEPEAEETEVLLFEGKVTITDNEGTSTTMLPGDYAVMGGGGGGTCVLSYPSTSLRALIAERFPTFSTFLASQDITAIPNPASPTLLRGFNKTRAGLLSSLDQARESSGPTSDNLVATGTSGPATFRWDPVPGASSYGLFVASDSGLEDLLFSTRTTETGFEMPEGARGLDGGTYQWAVVALDEGGEPIGPPKISTFQTSGWTTAGIELDTETE